MFKSVLAFGLACFVIASAADAAPRTAQQMPVLPGSAASADLHEANYHRHQRHHQRQYQRHRHHYQRHYHAPRRHHAPRVHHGYSQAHYNWCSARYRSYNRHSNTWTAYSGKVYQCRSPY